MPAPGVTSGPESPGVRKETSSFEFGSNGIMERRSLTLSAYSILRRHLGASHQGTWSLPPTASTPRGRNELHEPASLRGDDCEGVEVMGEGERHALQHQGCLQCLLSRLLCKPTDVRGTNGLLASNTRATSRSSVEYPSQRRASATAGSGPLIENSALANRGMEHSTHDMTPL